MMTKEKLAELQKDGQQAIQDARVISDAAQAEKRDMTPSERNDYDASMTKARGILDQIEAAKRDLAVLDQAKQLAAEIGDPTGGGSGGAKAGQQLAFKRMASNVVRKIGAGSDGLKALATSGNVVVGQEFDASPIELGRPANSLLAVLPTRLRTTPEYAYLRQTARTNNAAVVAEGAVKPTSVYSTERIEDKLDVVAHLSEPVPRYWFKDNDTLEEFMASELLYGLEKAVEALALAEIAGTSGTQVQAYATSPLVTLRKTLTKLEAVGINPAAFVLHANDWEAIELALSSPNAIEYRGLPYDASSRRLYSVPVVVSLAQTQGVAHTLGEGAARIEHDNEVSVQWSETSNADDFSKNLIRARCEGRFATSVMRPLAVVTADLTA